MPFELAKEYQRLWSLNAGVFMVVTDLHGDWEIYQRYRDRYIELHAKEQVDGLIFTGDLIHSEADISQDRSVDIVLDVLKLQARFGEAIIYLCGNHELPHIYSFGLAKGPKEYTPSFEKVLSESETRSTVIPFFKQLPFYIRTAAGVSLTHAGATPRTKQKRNAAKLFAWDHDTQLEAAHKRLMENDIAGLRRAYARLSGADTYDELAQHYLAVSGVADPRYDDLIRGFFATISSDFDTLHAALFTRCEQEHKEDYGKALEALLQFLSMEYATQRVLVSGHVAVPDGYQIIADRQLRIASGVHAKPATSGKYLILDTAQSVMGIDDLLAGLQSVFGPPNPAST
jgi:hypothetical protein